MNAACLLKCLLALPLLMRDELGRVGVVASGVGDKDFAKNKEEK